MATLKEVFRQLLRDVRSQKLRTFLTVFGIVWGTVAVTLLLAFGTGLKKQLVKNAAGLGDRICIAWPGLTSVPYQGLGKGVASASWKRTWTLSGGRPRGSRAFRANTRTR